MSTFERPLFLDSETRSKAKLDDLGGREYARHPSTEVVCVCFETPDGEEVDWSPMRPREVSADVMGRELRGYRLVCAHNSIGFDRHVWKRLGWPEPDEWVDTSELARVGGYAEASLDYLATLLLGRRKDLEGNKLTKSLSTLSNAKATKGEYKVELTLDVLERVIRYCRSDVRDLVGIYDEDLRDWQGLDLDGYEEVQRRMNDRGILLDVDLMRRLLVLDDVLCERALRAVRLDRIEVSAPQRFRRHLTAALGYDPGGADKDVLAGIMADSPTAEVKLLVEARQAVASIARGKLRAGLDMRSDDDRLRDNLRYYGAHTGRDSGQGMQLHNLTKGPPLELAESIEAAFNDEPHRCEVLHAANKKKGKAAEWHKLNAASLNTLVRACLKADEGYILLICDWAQIEGRKLSWAANEKEALKLYRRLDAGDKSADPYKVMAGTLWGIDPSEVDDKQRQLGKVAILGCGYQMGDVRFHAQAQLSPHNIDWSQYEITAKDVVKAWRKKHENTVAFWYEFQDAAVTVTEARGDREVRVGPFTWVKHDGLVFNLLPSGRVIVYRGMRTHVERGKWGKDRVSLSYEGRKGREYTYGGKLVENGVQASCGDLMREGVVEADRAGLQPMLTVHDELIGQALKARAKEAFEELRRIMCKVPEWCHGMPIAAEGFTSDRYKKG